MSVEKWIAFWRNHEGSGYHADDCSVINTWGHPQNREIDSPLVPTFPLARKDRGKLHPRLTPVPYVGDIRSARIIFFALLNPTVCCRDYADNEKDEFHKLLERNRLQEDVQGCFAMRRQFTAPSWSEYYRSVLKSSVECATDLAKNPRKTSGKLYSTAWPSWNWCLITRRTPLCFFRMTGMLIYRVLGVLKVRWKRLEIGPTLLSSVVGNGDLSVGGCLLTHMFAPLREGA